MDGKRVRSSLLEAGLPFGEGVTSLMREEGGRGLPLVSIVIPTYNRWPMVAEAVQSALAQDMALVEVIVVDDGSEDDTVAQLTARYPEVRLLRQANTERGAARNRGAATARGTYLGFLDADDVLEPWHVSQLVTLLHSRRRAGLPSPPVVAGPAVLWDPLNGRCRPLQPPPLRGRLPLTDAVLLGTVLPLPGLFVQASAFGASSGFPEDRRLATNEDWVFLARLVSRFPTIVRLEHISVRIRDHAGRSMGNIERACSSRMAATALILDEGLNGRALDERQRRLLVAGSHRFCAAMRYQGGEMPRAREHLRLAAAAAGWRMAGPLCGRLWAQTWLGRRGSSFARRMRTRLQG